MANEPGGTWTGPSRRVSGALAGGGDGGALAAAGSGWLTCARITGDLSQRRRLEQLNVVANGGPFVSHQSGKVTLIVPARLCWQW